MEEFQEAVSQSCLLLLTRAVEMNSFEKQSKNQDRSSITVPLGTRHKTMSVVVCD
jgi:hypothetical protein